MYLFKSFYQRSCRQSCLTLIALRLNGTHVLISISIKLKL